MKWKEEDKEIDKYEDKHVSCLSSFLSISLSSRARK